MLLSLVVLWVGGRRQHGGGGVWRSSGLE